MTTTNRRVRPDDILGAVLRNPSWNVVAAKPYQWALEPSKILGREPVGWDGVVQPTRISGEFEFLGITNIKELQREEVAAILDSAAGDDLQPWLMIVIDLDRKLFVSAYFDQPLENYIPDTWEGRFDDPYKYVPPELAAWWPTQPRALSQFL